ncbi:MAG: hypothetical protein ACRCW0_04620 [Clostridium sp.]
MSKIKSISGPNKEEVWEKLSEDINGKISYSISNGRKIEAMYNEIPLVFEYYTMMAGKIPISYTRIRAVLKDVEGFRFKITNRSELNTIGEKLDMKEVVELDDSLKERFIIKTNKSEKIKGIITNKDIMEILNSYQRFVLEIRTIEGSLEGEEELVFRTLGIIKNIDKLKELYNTICKTLDYII